MVRSRTREKKGTLSVHRRTKKKPWSKELISLKGGDTKGNGGVDSQKNECVGRGHEGAASKGLQ